MKIYTRCDSCNKKLELTDTPYNFVNHENCPLTEDQKTISMLRVEIMTAVMDGNDARADQLSDELNEVTALPTADLATSAVAYASIGWPVFPVARNGKVPAIPKTKGGRGFKDATTDIEQVRAWWRRYPNSNIGVATGHRFDVVDFDFDKGSALRWIELKDDPNFVVHGLATTPNGLHAYVLPTGDGNAGSITDGVDYRGLGGYVVVPPSVRTDRRYQWWTRPSYELIRKK